MGPTGMLVSLCLLATAGLLAANLKSRHFRGFKEKYRVKPDARERGPLISVIIPARNEEGVIEGLLESLLSQEYRDFEIIVVDDSSEDDTALLVSRCAARDDRIRLIEAGELREGWTGKCNACADGTAVARGEYFLYLDADVRLLDPGALGGMIAYAIDNKVALLSLVPKQELKTFVERFFSPSVYVIMALEFLPYREVNDPARPKAAAVGQCLLFEKSAYHAVGGHGAVKDWIAEDMRFARIVKSRGMHLVLLDGSRILAVRMYKSLGEIWQGWTKHLYLSAAGGPWSLARRMVMLSATFLAPPAVMLWAAVSLGISPTWYAAAVLATAAAMETYGFFDRSKHYRNMGWPVLYELALAPCMAFALVLLGASAVKHAIPGGLSWKGRRYSSAKVDS